MSFCNLASSYTFRTLHTLPTIVTDTSATILNVIFSNSVRISHTSGILIDDISDHFHIFTITDIKLPAATKYPDTVTSRKITAYKLENLKNVLGCENLSNVFKCNNGQ